MIDEKTIRETAEAEGVGGGRPAETLTDTAVHAAPGEPLVAPPPAFTDKPTLRLAHDHKIKQSPEPSPDELCAVCSIPFGGHAAAQERADQAHKHEFKRPQFKSPFHRPITIDAHVNIGMGLQVFFPSLKEQIAGFTPYYLDEKKEKQNATKIVLENFLGIYKSVEPGPEEKAQLAQGAALV